MHESGTYILMTVALFHKIFSRVLHFRMDHHCVSLYSGLYLLFEEQIVTIKADIQRAKAEENFSFMNLYVN